VRVDPNDYPVHPGHLLAHRPGDLSEDGQRYFELGRPFLSHASPRHLARVHAMKEPHPALQAGSRKKSAQPGTSPEPALTQAV
jgi:hypothetical protein